jgi:hypothetical protein
MGSITWQALPGDWVKALRIGEFLQIGKGTTM